MSDKPLSLQDWLITETVRVREERGGRLDDAAALAAGQAATGGLARRLVARARALPEGQRLADDVRLWLHLLVAAGMVLMLVAAVSGIAAARVSVAEREINILLSLLTLLGLPTLMLLLWCVLLLAGRRRSTANSLMSASLRLLPGLMRPRSPASPLAGDLTQAGASLIATPSGRWLLSSVSHAFWLVYALTAIGTLTVFFAVVEYDLVWGTTTLTEDRVLGLVSLVSSLPVLLGLMPPLDPETVLAARQGSSAAEVRGLMAQFLLATIIAWAVLPRSLLALLSASLAIISARRMQLDTGQPGYQRLLSDLAPVAREVRTFGQLPADTSVHPRRRSRAGAGAPVLIGIELERSHEEGVPRIPGVEAQLLGRADDRAGREAVLDQISKLKKAPAAVLAVCSMLRTPDAGIEALLARISEAADAPLVLILDEQSELEQRGDSVGARLSDWEALAGRFGTEATLLDSSAPQAVSIARIQDLLADPA